MNQYVENSKAEFEKVLAHLKEELAALRTGRANPAMIEKVMVEAYGAHTPLNQLGNISLMDSQTLTVEPWDKSILKDVEKGLSLANLGLSIINNGERIIAKVPQMTEENRKQMVKVLGGKVEDAKIAIRQVRDKVKEQIIEAEKNKDITQDDRYSFLTDLDNYVTELNKKLLAISEEKEQDIMTI